MEWTDEGIESVFAATGGQPRLIQRFGFHLFQRWEMQPNHTTLTQQDVKQITPLVYNQSETELRTVWTETTRNERLVLTAISSLLYADPLLNSVSPAKLKRGW